MKKVIVLLFGISIHLCSQVMIKNESIVNGKYILDFAIRSNIQSGVGLSFVQQKKNIDTETIDRPSYELFIALPPNSKPTLSFVPIRQTVLHENERYDSSYIPITYFEFRGYLWTNDYYCAHFTIHPVSQKNPISEVSELVEFRIEVDMQPNWEVYEETTHTDKDPVIVNPRYGQKWKTIQHYYSIENTDSWIDYNHDYIKLGVFQDGIYRITKLDLMNYGVPVNSLNPNTLKIYLRGIEIPTYIHGGEDNVFGDSDYVEFVGRKNYGDTRYREPSPFGTSYYEYIDKYSDTTIYWLTWDGTVGNRIDTVTQYSSTPLDTIRYFDHLEHIEKNVYWDFSLDPNNQTAELRRNDPELLENETWNEGNLNVGTISIPFIVTNLYPQKPSRAFVKLQDYASSVQNNAHNLALSINNGMIRYDSGYINKYQVKVLAANISSSTLQNGTNTIDIHSFPTSSSINTIIRDWYELEYPKYLRLTNDTLIFGYSNLSDQILATISITGLAGGPVSLFKYVPSTNYSLKIKNYIIRNDTLLFPDTIKNGNQYYLIRENKISSPLFYYKKKFVNLRNPLNKADYIAITHPYFQSSVNSYASFIAKTYGVETTVVLVNDIFDEFNYGMFSPEPIKEFLKSVTQFWQSPKPKYVVLIGKGTYDFYGNKTKYFGAPITHNFIPPYGNPVSDIWFVQWDSTGSLIPQMNIGRIPVKTIAEFQSYVAKHQKYVNNGYDEWNKRFLFFSGGNITDPNQIAQAKATNDFIITNYVTKKPIGGNAISFYKTTSPITNFGPYSQEYITSQIEKGGTFISYIGHSGTQTWDNSITDITQLSNTRDRNPMISDFGCSTGKFAEPDVVSFSEAAVTSIDGQAISYIGNSSLGFTSTAYTYPQIFYKKLLIDTSASLGEIHRLSKIDYIKQFGSGGSYGLFIKTNTLIGDPIVSIPIPQKANLSVLSSQYEQNPEYPTDQNDSVSLTIPFANLGKVTEDSISIAVNVEYKGNSILSKKIRRLLPLNYDSLVISIPIKNNPGSYYFTVTLDSDNSIDEIYENDNVFIRPIQVSASTIRTLSLSQVSNQSNGTVLFLNPVVQSPFSGFLMEISSDPSFSPKQSFPIQFDTFFTSININTEYSDRRFWIRSKYQDDSGEGIIYSFIFGNRSNIYFKDSISFNQLQYRKMKYVDPHCALDTSVTTISTTSAGLNDGSTAVIQINGQNVVPQSELGGHHVCIFDRGTFALKYYRRFLVSSGGSEITDYENVLDTVNINDIVVIAISNDGGSNLSINLKNKIKDLGSIYIDSVKTWSSWAIIGKKGSIPGSVPEKFSNPFQGRVQIESSFVIPDTLGSFESQPIGPVARWKDIALQYTELNSGSISMAVVGLKEDGDVDTVKHWNNIDSVIDISDIDAKTYPTIRFNGIMKRRSNESSPLISSIEVNYDPLPELGTNYQTVRLFHWTDAGRGKEIVPEDTVQQGEKVDIVYRVYNAGGVPAKNTSAKVQAIWDNNTSEPVSVAVIDSIGVKSYKEYSAQYNTSLGFGKRNIQITIDPDTTIRELYKDNNIFVFPFVVAKNQSIPLLPNLAVDQSGIQSVSGEITTEADSALFRIVYQNTGALVNDSITISVKHFYQSSLSSEKIIRRKYPVSNDTVVVSIPILKRSGEHAVQVDLDAVGLITESNENDNSATRYFTVLTTDYRVIQPVQNSISAAERIIFLNPTSIDSTLPRVTIMEIDTAADYHSKLSLQSQMKEFTSEFSIASLAKKKRYFWRVKQQNSQKDWTAGSFFLGESSAFVIGQVDSLGWMTNSFIRTSFTTQNGAGIVNTQYVLQAGSAGFNDGLNGSLLLNGVNILSPILGPGHNITVLDTSTFVIKKQRRFNIAGDPAEVDSMIQFISSTANGDIVVNVVVDDGANNLTGAGRNIFKSIGSAFVDSLAFRDSWSIIGRKGAAIGSVSEQWKKQGTGAALVSLTTTRKESSGRIITVAIPTYSGMSSLNIIAGIPTGSHLSVKVVGISPASADTVISSLDQLSVPLLGVNTSLYSAFRIVFDLTANASFTSPMLREWSIAATQPVELATSLSNASVSKSVIMEGEKIEFTSKIFNLGSSRVDSIPVRIKSIQSGLETVLNDEVLHAINGNDSTVVSYTYDSRGKKGNIAIAMEIDPLKVKSELTRDNNSVTIPLIVVGDSLKPIISVTIDGQNVVNGDYIGQSPEIIITYTDNNPSLLLPADTSNFKIRLNNSYVPFISGTAELRNITQPGRAEVRWSPELKDGENILQIFALDVTGNSSDTITLFVNVASKFKLMDVYNLPNPFNQSTHFTFTLAGPVIPEEAVIKIFTVAGRLIQELHAPAVIGFNDIYWDGRDRDGDQIGNGVYFYRLIVKHRENQITATSKLVKMR